MRFSVITPSFNQAGFIRKTIESVLEQEGDFEHIVIDGGSNDGTVDVLKEYAHVRWVSEPDRGQADALNKGLAMADGEIVAWINSDDFYAPGAFARARSFFAAHPEADILCGNQVVVDQTDAVVRRGPPKLDRARLLHPWRHGTSVFQPAILFRRRVYDACGPFDVGLRYAMDYAFFLRATGRFAIHTRPEDYGCFRVYRGTKTGDAFGPAFAEVKQVLPAYMAAEGLPGRDWAALRLHLGEADVWVCDAMNAADRGATDEARRLFGRALARNPLSYLIYAHVCWRLRNWLGAERYERLRTMLRGTRADIDQPAEPGPPAGPPHES